MPAKVTALFEDFETKLQQAAAQKDLPDIVINDTAQLGTPGQAGPGARGRPGRAWPAAPTSPRPPGTPPRAPTASTTRCRSRRSRSRCSSARTGARRSALRQPTTWAELDALAKAFTTEDPDGNGKADTYGYVIPARPSAATPPGTPPASCGPAGGDFFTGTPGKFTPAVNSPAVGRRGEVAQGASSAPTRPWCPGAVTAETTQAHPLFETGKGGIYFTGPYNMARFDKNLGKDKYEVVALPGRPGRQGVVAGRGRERLPDGRLGQPGRADRSSPSSRSPSRARPSAWPATPTATSSGSRSTPRSSSARSARTPAGRSSTTVYKAAGRYTPAVPDWTPFRQTSADTFNAIVADCALRHQGRAGQAGADLHRRADQARKVKG